MQEKTKALVHKLTWLAILLLIIFIPIIVNVAQPELELVNDNCYIDNYYTYLDETSVDIELEFNRQVNSGYAKIMFYDSEYNLLETKTVNFYGYGDKIVENSYVLIDGKVDSYQVIYYEFEPTITSWFYLYYLLIPVIVIFICSLLISYKEYQVGGKTISVYAGWYHHTLRIDGTKYDEHNTIVSHTPIKLSTTLEDGTKLEATISLTNRITLKANDKLVSN